MNLRYISQTRFDRYVLYLAVGIIAWELVLLPLIPFGGTAIPKNGELAKAQEQLVTLYKDQVQNLILLAIGMAGAASLAAYNRWPNRTLPEDHARILKSCWFFTGLSVCSGLIGEYHLRRLLEHRLIHPQTLPLTAYPSLIQFSAVLAAAPFLAWFVTVALMANDARRISL